MEEKYNLPPTDFNNLEKSIRSMLLIEIFHNIGLIKNEIYYKKYNDNAETFERDYRIWKELKKINE